MNQTQTKNILKSETHTLASIKRPAQSLKMAIVLMINALLFTGCINYYKISSTDSINTINKTQLEDGTKHIVVHLKDTSYALKNLSIKENTLAGSLAPLNNIELKYIHPSSSLKNRYRKADGSVVLNQMDIYAESTDLPGNLQLSIPTTAITKIGINEKNRGATRSSHYLGAGIIIGSIVLLGGLVASASLGGY